MLKLGIKAIGLGAMMFCVGMICGLVFPIYVVVIIETALLLFIAYYCLFKCRGC